MAALCDGFGRSIDYLRISVTDKCNFRCVYCMPEEGVPPRTHSELLSVEETARFVRIVAGVGIRHVRLTGGEPLVSRKLLPLVKAIRSIPEIEDISLTTNGALLPRYAAALKEAGLDRVNISLDTLDPEQFAKITRLGTLEQVLCGIDAALEQGLDPVKVNCVAVRRLHQDVFSLASMTQERPLHVRFIEYMPIGGTRGPMVCEAESPSAVRAAAPWDESDIVGSDELRAHIDAAACSRGLPGLEQLGAESFPVGAGPAQYWRFPGAAGTIGFISAMSKHFCASCNRLRLTADGSVRPCLFSDREYPVHAALGAGNDDEVLHIWRTALKDKPKEHAVSADAGRYMSQIGG